MQIPDPKHRFLIALANQRIPLFKYHVIRPINTDSTANNALIDAIVDDLLSSKLITLLPDGVRVEITPPGIKQANDWKLIWEQRS